MSWIPYKAMESIITTMQRQINIFDSPLGISYQIRWISIMAYSKNVAAFPCQSALNTCFVFRITRSPITPSNTSFITRNITGASINGKRVKRQMSIAPCVNLSAIGSKTLPSALTIWNRLAIYPSAKSVAPDSSSTIAVHI